MAWQLQDLQTHLRTWLGKPASAYLSGVEVSELDRIMRDLDAYLSDMPLITRPNAGPSALLPQRLSLFGLDPAYVQKTQSTTFRDLQEACSACQGWRRCARDLARGNVTFGMEHYCKNAEPIEALLLKKTKG